jgi:hypothetical protein
MSVEHSASAGFYVMRVLFFFGCYQAFFVLEKFLGEAFVMHLETISEVSYNLPCFLGVCPELFGIVGQIEIAICIWLFSSF